MTLTTLDAVPALILVDLQKGILASGYPGVPSVLDKAATLAHAFREHALPVVLVNTSPGGAPGRTDAAHARQSARQRPRDWADLAPELGSHPDDILITKRTWGAFYDTGLDEKLRARGVAQLVIGGVATSRGVESTARAAHEHGYHVVLPIDMMLDSDQTSHEHSIGHIFPRIGEITTTAELLKILCS
ncbi:MAG: isochorismatase family protein [Bifidobacterium tibiigranuli]|jgi:nicotinamidase-related amidase|uniref:isochorismatase family protein n=1 Tax=Bifidobacterium tibiigranuli TaxID=2172043 RepID=UPI0026F16121|nr:isochorismatase family protein [Bifidobacterium tibiigranuli]MCI1672679.1 isochorismatase family protein [Bifidobacterium tibiigranuli]MCI1712316.1 isochorismatase family protein [Bifidobacterium tibiigranuli]MCI1833314.1 isochorismatase family protein [Bifidobacterium tibiigranuli]